MQNFGVKRAVSHTGPQGKQPSQVSRGHAGEERPLEPVRHISDHRLGADITLRGPHILPASRSQNTFLAASERATITVLGKDSPGAEGTVEAPAGT